MSHDSLGDRMKGYEDVSRVRLTTKLPVIIRLDGKAFHTYTRGLKRPYDQNLMEVMNLTTKYLCNQIQNVKLAYTQSDEISLLLVDYGDIKTSSWFDGNLQKMVSVAAGLASSFLTARSPDIFHEIRLATFDARAFILPQHEVCNYFIWRQQDWNRNSLSMLAQSLYSHKELQNKGRGDQHEMCFQKGYNWADLSSHLKDGRVVIKRQVEKEFANEFLPGQPPGTREIGTVLRSEWYIPEETPVFTADREFVERLVRPA
jgi:tRNA(His) 5'-end guanylyltransferase